MSEAIGQVIRRLRTEKELPLKEMSEKVGLSYSYMSQIEKDERNASAVILSKVANALGVSKLYLYKVAGYLDETDILEVVAENKRLREALTKISSSNDYDGMDRIYYQELSIELIHIARKALGGDSYV